MKKYLKIELKHSSFLHLLLFSHLGLDLRHSSLPIHSHIKIASEISDVLTFHEAFLVRTFFCFLFEYSGDLKSGIQMPRKSGIGIAWYPNSLVSECHVQTGH